MPELTSPRTGSAADSSATGSSAAQRDATARCSRSPPGSRRRSSPSGSGSTRPALRNGSASPAAPTATTSRSALRDTDGVSVEANKQLVRRLVIEAVGQRNPDVVDELAVGEFARAARRWVTLFQSAFPDFEMEIVELIAEDDKVVAHFRCSGTHLGEWLGQPATGRRFERVDEIYIFQIHNGKLVSGLGVEDNLTRLRQLGFAVHTD
jgi:predicted ester cyclase